MGYQQFRSVRRYRRQRHVGAAVCCLLLSLSVSVGCRRGGPEVVPVRGTITFGGGQWPKAGIVYFVVDSSSTGQPQRPGLGEFDTGGTLTVTTFKKGDGLLPGKYRITVECWETPPQMGSPTSAKSYVPDSYRSAATSNFTVQVESGQKEVNLHLDVPRK
jgi:hypothetical protein